MHLWKWTYFKCLCEWLNVVEVQSAHLCWEYVRIHVFVSSSKRNKRVMKGLLVVCSGRLRLPFAPDIQRLPSLPPIAAAPCSGSCLGRKLWRSLAFSPETIEEKDRFSLGIKHLFCDNTTLILLLQLADLNAFIYIVGIFRWLLTILHINKTPKCFLCL